MTSNACDALEINDLFVFDNFSREQSDQTKATLSSADDTALRTLSSFKKCQFL